MAIGAALWGFYNQIGEFGSNVTKPNFIGCFEEDIDDLFSRRLTAKAQKYGVSQSQFHWYWSKHRKHFLLTPAATEALNSTVHEARKRRGEVFRLWLPALASTISAFVALAAVILGRR